MSCPQVSVIVPTHNRASLLCQALDSISEQSFRDYEVIIIDDGGTDETAQVVRQRSEPFRYLWQEQRGAAAARNYALSEARADLVAFLDSDDIWLPQFLADVVHALRARPSAAMAYSDFRTVNAQGRELRGHRKRQHGGDVIVPLFASIFIHTSCVVARRDILVQAGGFDDGLEASEDYDLWLRLSLKYPFVSITEPLCLRRSHNGSLSRNGDVGNLAKKARLLEDFYDQHGGKTIPGDLAHRRLGKVFYSAGKATARHRDFTQSVSLLRRSMDHRNSAKAWPWYLVSLALRGTPADRGRTNGQVADESLA